MALNFQTPGLMMDLYDGKFSQNGGCGYVLKPAMMRQPGFSMPSNIKENMPTSPPQLLRIRVHNNLTFLINHYNSLLILNKILLTMSGYKWTAVATTERFGRKSCYRRPIRINSNLWSSN